MKLKTYVARDPQEALAQVRKEMGPEAVILSTQSRRRHSPESGWGRQRSVEVTAAVDQGVGSDPPSTSPAWPQDHGNSSLAYNHLREELEEMKGLLRQWLWEHGPPAWLAPYQELARLFQALLRAGVNDQVMRQWLEEVRELLEGSNGPPPNLRERALRQLLQAVKVVDPWKMPHQGPRRWTFLGSTGVGKTTTIAKLAVRAAFMKKKRVGLISLDHVRLGGQDQLAAYARITGLPLTSVQSRAELAEALENMTDLEVILVDTPGRNPRDPELHRELSRLLGDLPGLEHHLVLSGTTLESNLAATLEVFGVLPLASCIITKVDESRDFAGIFNQLSTKKVPLSYLATGQRVPEDLELASRRRLAGLLLNSPGGQGGKR